MLDPAAVAALLAARHSDPFSVLGLHADAGGALWLRALLPGANAVVVLDATSGKQLVELMRIHHDGLFEARIRFVANASTIACRCAGWPAARVSTPMPTPMDR